MITWKNIDEIDDFLSFMLVYCPNRFLPRHKFDLESAFDTLNRSVLNCSEQFPPERLNAFLNLAQQSLAAYRKGNALEGSTLIQEMERLIANRGRGAL